MAFNFNFGNLSSFGLAPIDVKAAVPAALSQAELAASASRAASSPLLNVSAPTYTVDQLYQALGREADPGGYEYWSGYQGPDLLGAFQAGAQASGETFDIGRLSGATVNAPLSYGPPSTGLPSDNVVDLTPQIRGALESVKGYNAPSQALSISYEEQPETEEDKYNKALDQWADIYVNAAYESILGRPPDQDGLDFYKKLAKEQGGGAVLDALAFSEEGRQADLAKALADPAADKSKALEQAFAATVRLPTPEDMVQTAAYSAVGEPLDATGVAYYVEKLQTGQLDPESLARDIAFGAQSKTQQAKANDFLREELGYDYFALGSKDDVDLSNIPEETINTIQGMAKAILGEELQLDRVAVLAEKMVSGELTDQTLVGELVYNAVGPEQQARANTILGYNLYDVEPVDQLVTQISDQYSSINAGGYRYRGRGSELDRIYQGQAKKLADMGITSIYDLGFEEIPQTETIFNVTPYRGGYYYEINDSEGFTERKYIDEEDVLEVNVEPGRLINYGGGDDYMMPDRLSVTVQTDPLKFLTNKQTGERLVDSRGREVQIVPRGGGYERWGFDTSVKGQADYGIQFDENGIATLFPVYKDTSSKGDIAMIASILATPFIPQIGAFLGPGLSTAAQAAIGAGTVSAGTQLLATGKIDPLKTALSAGVSYVGTTGGFTGADVAADAAQLAEQGLSSAQIADVLGASGVNGVTANLAAQFASAGVPAEIAPMLTAGTTNGSLMGLNAIANGGDFGDAFKTGFLTGTAGEASSFAVEKLLGDEQVRAIARATNLTPSQVTGIAAASLQEGLNAEILNTGNLFDTVITTAVSLGVGESAANKISSALQDKMDPKSVAALTSMARDSLSVTTAAVMNNRDPNDALNASWVNIATNALTQAVRSPSQETVDAARQSKIDTEVGKVETSDLSSNPAAVEAYQNALGEGKTQEEAIDAAKRVVATERVDAAAAGTTTDQPITIKDETGADVEVFRVPSWNIKEGKIDPKPMENVYRDANGNVYVNMRTADGTSVTVSAPQFLSTALGIGIQSATELAQNMYNGVGLIGMAAPDSVFSKLMDRAQDIGAQMESPEIQAGKEDIRQRLSQAEGWDIMRELVASAVDNPEAAASFVAIELPQELALIGVAAKITKMFGLVAGLSSDAMLNAIDAAGADAKPAYEDAIKAGKSPEEALDIALSVGGASAALAGIVSPAVDFPFLKGATKTGVSTAGKTGTEVAADIAQATGQAGRETGKEFVEETFQSGTVAALSDFLITGQVDPTNALRQGLASGFYGGPTGGATSLTMSTINTSTGPVANNLSVVDPTNASSHLTMINNTLTSSPDPGAAAATISSNLQNAGMSVEQANNIANTAIAENIVAEVNANAIGQFSIADLNTTVGIDSNRDAVTLGDLLGSSSTGLSTSSYYLNPNAVIGTDTDGTPMTVQDMANMNATVTIDTSTTSDPNTGVTTETSTNVNPNTNVTTETNVTTDPDTNVTTETSTNVDPNTNTVTETNVTTNPDTNTQTETNVETNVDTNTQTTTNIETEIDTGKTSTTRTEEPLEEEEEEKFRRLLRGGAAGATLLAMASPATSKITLPEETWLGGKVPMSPEMLDLFKNLFAKDTPEMQEQEIYSALRRASGIQDRTTPRGLISEPSSYYSYGAETSPETFIRPFKRGGTVQDPISDDTMGMSPLLMAKGDSVPHKGSHYVQGAGGGQDDLIPAKLADGEYVFDAEIVAALGDGSNKEGAKILDKFREEIRKHKRSGSTKTIPPKAKNPLSYLKSVT